MRGTTTRATRRRKRRRRATSWRRATPSKSGSSPPCATTLTLTPVGGDPTEIAVAPWPFRGEAVTLVSEGRRLPETFADEGAMRAALARAPWVTIATRLRPG